ncbi:phytochrome A-associated F-box protein [Abrus precatorius]|uniref:Phytochrome A-associated F-box protein n=1 Tax=Abrus precatorius TaxID=3816 RepID=A0A8B8MJ76_ABRPR|nr:phytochrome A-associated F-box protein [Abrus precatorius]
MEETVFSSLTDDTVLAIFAKLEDDPRHWARLACVCTRFSSLVRHICWKNKCSQTYPSLLSDLLSDSPSPPETWTSLLKLAVCCPGLRHAGVPAAQPSCGSHLACGNLNLSREQGCKLLARQFRDDWLYVCYWPGCVHVEEKRSYRLFRGVFKNFKGSGVWRSINDGKRSKVDIGCAFCTCTQTWGLHSAFCLRRGFGYHDDGEPVVRAYVCENGHVSGAWTDVPMFS